MRHPGDRALRLRWLGRLHGPVFARLDHYHDDDHYASRITALEIMHLPYPDASGFTAGAAKKNQLGDEVDRG